MCVQVHTPVRSSAQVRAACRERAPLPCPVPGYGLRVRPAGWRLQLSRKDKCMKTNTWTRRSFLRRGLAFSLGAPLAMQVPMETRAVAAVPGGALPDDSAVGIARCRSYGPELRVAFDKCFDLLGGISRLVKDKTVTVKLNLTGTNFMDYLSRPVGETYMTHPASVMALGSALFASGARRVRFVESTNRLARLESTLALADWDIKALGALGRVEFENTRNLGSGRSYARLRVPSGGYMFTSFDLNQAYSDTDVLVSFTKLKNHVTAGVTLSMKNCFGITPNSLYGDQAGDEEATSGRGPLHDPRQHPRIQLPGLREGIFSYDPGWRIPRIISDICGARPIHLAIIDGITSVSGGEGPWCGDLKLTTPGVLIAGLNPVSTDAVGTAVMGYPDPRAVRGLKPFAFCDNHLLLAEQAGLGTADLARIDVRGLSLKEARYPYNWG